MAAIHEELVLADRFSSTFSRYIRLCQQASSTARMAETGQAAYTAAVGQSGTALQAFSGAAETAQAAQTAYTGAVERSDRTLEELSSAAKRAADAVEAISGRMEEAARATEGAAEKQEKANRKFREGAGTSNSLIGKIKSLAAAYLGLQTVQKFVGLSDTWTETTARLDRMNDGLQTTSQLQDMIYQAAQRSRGAYQDTANLVAKLGTLAGDAFGSSTEIVAFAEQINKQFALAGAGAQEASAATLQLTQALASGVLRGDELNSVMEQAPTIAQSIADYLGVSIGQVRELASEGQITAQVVKNAVFSAAEETNAAFEKIPMTFSQAWTMVKNAAVDAFRPAMETLNDLLNSATGQTVINALINAMYALGNVVTWVIDLFQQGAQWIIDNWNTVSTVLIGVAVGVGVAMMASAIKSAVAWAAANWPLLLIIGTIVIVIAMARKMGATWEDVCGVIGGVLYELYAFGYNLVADAWNLIATFAEFFANVFNNPVAAIANLFADLADWVLSIIQSIASAIDAVFGSNLSAAVGGWRSGLKNWVADTFGENEIVIQRMEKIGYDDAWNRGSTMGKHVGDAIDNFNIENYLGSITNTANPFGDYSQYFDDMTGSLDDISGDTSAIRSSVSLSEEDMKMLLDMAERKYINHINLTAQTPVINVTGQNTGDNEADRNALAEAIKVILLEQSASHTALSYH